MANLLKLDGVSVPKETKATGKANKQYREALAKVKKDLSDIIERQELAKLNIKEYNHELTSTGVDVAVVIDDLKRKELLDRRATLRDKIEEEELYLNLDYEAYKKRIIDEIGLDDFKYHAGREYRELHLQVEDYKKELQREAKRSSDLAHAMANNDNEYLVLLHDHETLAKQNFKRWENERES